MAWSLIHSSLICAVASRSLFYPSKRRTKARESPQDLPSSPVKPVLALTSEALKNIEHRQNTSSTVRPSVVASRLINGFEWLITLLHKFDSYESEDSAQKRCA